MHRHLIALGAAATAVVVLTVYARASQLPDWSAAVNLGPMINTAYGDGGPAISEDGRALYFQSSRPGGIGFNNCDLYVARRDSVDHPWDEPRNLGSVINTELCENSPGLSRDEHRLFFARPGANGLPDVWVSYRPDVADDLGWELPVPLGPAINTDAAESTPKHFESKKHGLSQLYFYSTRPGGIGGADLYVADAFGASMVVQGLNSPAIEGSPAISRSGLEILFHSNRPGTVGDRDLWISVRPSIFSEWGLPVNLGSAVNSQSMDLTPSISSDGDTLFFASDRPGGFGSSDIYMTARRR